MLNPNFIMNLPEKEPYNINNLSKEDLDEEQSILVDKLKDFIEKNVFTWKKLREYYTTNDHIYNLPSSFFSENTQINYANYNQVEVEYNDDQLSLTDRQLNDIWENGRFSVESKVPGLPYIWKLSEWTVKGREKIKKTFFKDLGRVFTVIYHIKDRFLSSSSFDLSLSSSFYELFKGFWSILNLIIGTPKLELNDQYTLKISQLISKDYAKRIAIRLEENQNIHDYSILFHPKLTKINSIQESFDEEWHKEEIILEQDLFNQLLPESEIKRRLVQLKNERLLEKLQLEFPNDPNALKEVINAIQAFKKYKKCEIYYNKQLEEEKNKLRENIKIQNYIRSYNIQWLNSRIEEEIRPSIERLEKEKNERILHKLEKYHDYKIIFEENEKKNKNYNILAETFSQNFASELPEKTLPKRNFYFHKSLFPPYDRVETLNSENRIEYTLVKYKEYKVHTKYLFWRIWLMLARFYVWSSNIAFFMFLTSWNSPFGLKALFVEEIFMNVSCDRYTGEITYTDKVFTYISTIKSLFKWIAENRDEFESSPDTGFFGKNFARIFNLFYNYVIILLIFGFFVILVYPVCIVLYSIFGVFCGLTCFVWSLLFVLINFLIKLYLIHLAQPLTLRSRIY